MSAVMTKSPSIPKIDEQWFTGLMGEWARLMEDLEGLGYPTATTLYTVQFGPGSGEFGSQLPPGIKLLDGISGELRELCRAIQRLENDPDENVRKATEAACLFYRYGKVFAADILGMSASSVWIRIKAGEVVISREMRR